MSDAPAKVRRDRHGNELPDPGPRCEACHRPLLGATPELIRTTVIRRIDTGRKRPDGKPLTIEQGVPGEVAVCALCAPFVPRRALS